MKSHFYISILFSLLIFSCSPSKKISTELLSFEEIIKLNESNSKRIESYTANGRIKLGLRNLQMSFDISIQAKKNQKALIEIYGPFGLSIATIYLNGDSIYINNEFREQLIITRFSSDKMKRVIPPELDSHMIYSLLFWDFNPSFIESDSSTIKFSDSEICVFKFSNDKKYNFCYDSKNLYLSSFIYEDDFLKSLIRVDFEEFVNIDGIFFPTKLKFQNNGTDENIIISLNNVKLNSLQNEPYFDMPENVEVIIW